MKNKIYHEYGNNTSKYKFNTLLKYLSEDFGVKHIKDDEKLIDNLSKKMIIIYEAKKNVPLPTFDQLIEKIKQNEKSKRSKKIIILKVMKIIKMMIIMIMEKKKLILHK